MNETEKQQNQSGSFHLKNLNYNPQIFYIFTVSSIISFAVSLILIIKMSESQESFSKYNFILPVLVIMGLIFATSSLTEYKGKSDYIKITKDILFFQHSPNYLGFTKSGKMKFSEIDSIRVVQIKSGLDLLDERIKQAQFKPEGYLNSNLYKKLLLEIQKKDGTIIRIGERLPSSGIIQAAVLIEGRAKLEDIYTKFQEKFPLLARFAKEAIGNITKIFRK